MEPILVTVTPVLLISAHKNKSASGRIFAFTFSGIVLFLAGLTKHSSTFTGSETAANLNSSNAKTVTVKAKWKSNCTGDCSEIDVAVNGYVDYTYTGSIKGVTLKKAGYYKLEVWGSMGGAGHSNNNTSSSVTEDGGYGGYSYGVISKNANDVIYVVVGGKDAYNGGGKKSGIGCGIAGDGGGATHIATASGLLSSLSSSTNRAKVLVVAGGGGGGSPGMHSANCTWNVHKYNSGGGYKGGWIQDSGGGNSSITYNTDAGGKQNTGGTANATNGQAGSFGQGGNVSSASSSYSSGGGGGGWYGGASGGVSSSYGGQSGGGGSGYIGNSLLLSAKGVTKQMYQYSYGCTSSTAAATKTTCTSSTGAHVANAANTGNGYARITYLGT